MKNMENWICKFCNKEYVGEVDATTSCKVCHEEGKESFEKHFTSKEWPEEISVR
tara:strand:+ start:558 stop:719 length:162 start_codon:yes stop_codon:yes gene_type:complete